MARTQNEEAAAAVADAASDAEASVVVDEDAGRKIYVGDEVGSEITFSRGVDVVLTKRVTDGHVTAKDDAERALILGSVPGAKLAD